MSTLGRCGCCGGDPCGNLPGTWASGAGTLVATRNVVMPAGNRVAVADCAGAPGGHIRSLPGQYYAGLWIDCLGTTPDIMRPYLMDPLTGEVDHPEVATCTAWVDPPCYTHTSVPLSAIFFRRAASFNAGEFAVCHPATDYWYGRLFFDLWWRAPGGTHQSFPAYFLTRFDDGAALIGRAEAASDTAMAYALRLLPP